jgi:inosine-uridine nucleoside N-ribohydrolase
VLTNPRSIAQPAAVAVAIVCALPFSFVLPTAASGQTTVGGQVAAPGQAAAPQAGGRGQGGGRFQQRGPRARVVILNDDSGDPDGLVATAHAFLSPAAEVRAFVGTRGGTGSPDAAANGKVISDYLGMQVPAFVGSNDLLTDRKMPKPNAGSKAIIDEANRTDAGLPPLYVTVGGDLTDVASALLQDPSIAAKFTLIWIGGADYPAGGRETNFGIDPIAAQVVFDDFDVPIWQIPRNVYFQAQVPYSELKVRMAPYGELGAWLFNKLMSGRTMVDGSKVLGDSPLVLLTALSSAAPTTSYETRPTPILNNDGTYTDNPKGRGMRLYKTIDTRYFMEDFYAKLQLKFPRP